MAIQGYRLWHAGRVRRNREGLCAVDTCGVRLVEGATYEEGDFLFCPAHPSHEGPRPLRKPLSDLELFVWLTKESACSPPTGPS